MPRSAEGPAAYVESLAEICPSNAYLEKCFSVFLERNGYRLVRRREQAQVVVMNGCNANSANPETALKYAEFAKSHPDKTVLVAGCAPVLAGQAKLRGPNLHLLPYRRMLHCPGDVDAAVGAKVPFEFLSADGIEPERNTPFLSAAGVDIAGMHYVRVGDGCTENCGFCAVKSAKGGLRSLPKAEVEAQLEAGLAAGRRRFWLMSDELGAWGRDLGTDLPDLLQSVEARAPEAELFLHNVHPLFFMDRWERLRPLMRQVRFLWLSVHSGSDRVLDLMGRRYEARAVAALVDRLRAANPRMILSTEIIIGYPGETRAEFGESLVAAARFDLVRFSPMMVFEGTPAASQAGRHSDAELESRVRLARSVAERSSTHELCRLPQWPELVVWKRRRACC
jgi:tRNA A37 methylthiotransferase MiaB